MRPVPQYVPASSVLAPGDVVSIAFAGAPELSRSQKIRSDGRVTLPFVGDVDAAGKSPMRLEREVMLLCKPHLQVTDVTVGLEASSAAVYVSGAVNKPGKLPLERPMTAFEAVMEAGGFTEGLANPKRVLLIRRENDRHQTQVLDLSPSLRNETTNAYYLKPYDVLIVKERMF